MYRVRGIMSDYSFCLPFTPLIYFLIRRTANALCKLCCHEPDNEQCSDGRCKNWNDLCITKPNSNGTDTNNPPNGIDTNNPGSGYS